MASLSSGRPCVPGRLRRDHYLCNQCLSPLTLTVQIRSDEVYSIQQYVIKLVSDLRQVGGFCAYCLLVLINIFVCFSNFSSLDLSNPSIAVALRNLESRSIMIGWRIFCLHWVCISKINITKTNKNID
jgi:hypothetical protein